MLMDLESTGRSGVCLNCVHGFVPKSLFPISYLIFMACLPMVLWVSRLDELTHTEKPGQSCHAVSKFSQELLLGLILEIEVDQFGKRKQQREARSSGEVLDC